MTTRSLTMTDTEIDRVYQRAAGKTDCLQDGIVAVAREAEGRLLLRCLDYANTQHENAPSERVAIKLMVERLLEHVEE